MPGMQKLEVLQLKQWIGNFNNENSPGFGLDPREFTLQWRTCEPVGLQDYQAAKQAYSEKVKPQKASRHW